MNSFTYLAGLNDPTTSSTVDTVALWVLGGIGVLAVGILALAGWRHAKAKMDKNDVAEKRNTVFAASTLGGMAVLALFVLLVWGAASCLPGLD